mmetsp:Transcript_45983/g.146779  ORF Transcript_45983/g.146779 Transcript_45983/m.146779 type:complete len:241 (+) Transcript_45983:1217-1939(+)
MPPRGLEVDCPIVEGGQRLRMQRAQRSSTRLGHPAQSCLAVKPVVADVLRPCRQASPRRLPPRGASELAGALGGRAAGRRSRCGRARGALPDLVRKQSSAHRRHSANEPIREQCVSGLAAGSFGGLRGQCPPRGACARSGGRSVRRDWHSPEPPRRGAADGPVQLRAGLRLGDAVPEAAGTEAASGGQVGEQLFPIHRLRYLLRCPEQIARGSFGETAAAIQAWLPRSRSAFCWEGEEDV